MNGAGLFYAASFFMWLMCMEVAHQKSWEVFNISKGKHAVHAVICLVISAICMFWVGPELWQFRYDNLWLIPIVIPVYYLIYAVFNKKHRENWGESFKADRWNGLVLLSSTNIATVICVMV